MAQNQLLEQGGAQPLQVAVNPSLTYLSGQPILVGTLAAVTMTSNPPLLQPGTNVALQLPSTGNLTVLLAGAFSLQVTAKTSLSPSTGSNINPGDKLYVEGGTLDTIGNVTYGFTLTKNSSAVCPVGTGVVFGNAVSTGGSPGPLLPSSTTGFIAVRLKESA